MNIIFHIGYHKTASSWLQQSYFQEHPHIKLVNNYKEPWNDPFLNYLISTADRKFEYEQCIEIFNSQIKSNLDNIRKILLVSAERLSGHPFSGGYDSFKIAERICLCFPTAKILCVVRNQVDMICSVYKQLIAEGFPGKLETLLFKNHWKTVGFDMSFYEYDLLLAKYQTLFGEDNVSVLPYEYLLKDKKLFLQKMCNYFGVSSKALITPNKSIVNKSLPNVGLSCFRYMNYLRATEIYPLPLLNLNILYPAVLKILEIVMAKIDRPRVLLSNKKVQEIQEHYRKANARFKELTGIDYNSLCPVTLNDN